MSATLQLRLLQACVALGGCVPVGAGLAGIVLGQDLVGGADGLSASADGHVRYLSGLLLGIGLCFWSSIPGLLRKDARFRILTGIVVVGGLGRLYGFALAPEPAADTLLPLAMELAVTPALALWRERLRLRSSR